MVLVNPEIITASGEIECEEGCLSVPGYFDTVYRAARVTVRARNETAPFERTVEDMLAVCVQPKWTTSWAGCSSTTCRL